MRLQGLLRGGVTSVRDMGGDNRALAFMKRNAEIDVIQSPDIYYSVIIGGQEFLATQEPYLQLKEEYQVKLIGCAQ